MKLELKDSFITKVLKDEVIGVSAEAVYDVIEHEGHYEFVGNVFIELVGENNSEVIKSLLDLSFSEERIANLDDLSITCEVTDYKYVEEDIVNIYLDVILEGISFD